jgi:hypothetical protein
MAGYTSQDDLISKITSSGQYNRIAMAKTTAPVHTAGGWHSLVGLAGSPNAGTYPGTDLVYMACTESNGDGTVVIGPQHNGVVTPNTKHILSVGASLVAAAGAPWQAKLVDLQGYYRLSTTNVTGTGSRTLINSNTFTASSSSGLLLTYTNDFASLTRVRVTNSGGVLPTGLAIDTDYWFVRVSSTTARIATSLANAIAGTVIAYTDAGSGTHTFRIQQGRYDGGVGCEAFFVAQTAPTGGGPNLSASAYDAPSDYTGTGTRAFQGSPTMGAAADAYACRILHSGNAAGRFGPFLPRQAADTGIARINSFTWSGGSAYTGSGVVALCIARPLMDLALPVTGMWSERDLVNQLPSLPRIYDGACLAWLLFGTGATTTASPFTASLDIGWA